MALVSVVIPTRHRPHLVLRAIQSVLDQTYAEIELIVVVDGPDPTTVTAVELVSDPRLRLVVNPQSLSAAGARNVGAERATGDFIAFLDDDDEWLPHKLERQMAAASGCGTKFVSCLSRVVTPLATYIWPQVIYDNSIPLDEYLFDRRSLFLGSAFIQTSSFLLTRQLFNEIRFNVESPHDDWELVLRLSKEIGATIETVPEELVVLHFEEERTSLSSGATWSASLKWIESLRSIITPRAYSGFVLGVVGSRAAREGAYGAFFYLLVTAIRQGSPNLWQIAMYISFWLAPQRFRRRLRALFRGLKLPSQR